MTFEMTDALRRAKNGDKNASEQLIFENSGLIWSIARRFFGRGVEADDLYQLGCVGFLKAIAGYDEEYGTQFSTYAVPKISGEIRRFLRDDGAVKVSRGIKERAHTIRSTRSTLEQSLGREPTLSEISEETGLEISESVGSLPRLCSSELRVLLIVWARSLIPRLTLTAPSSRRNLLISPEIFGTA